jgi:hypothetical protein
MATDDYDDEDRPRRSRNSRDDYDDDRGGSRRDDDRDDYDDAPRRGNLKPHRGVMILIFGLLGLCCFIFPILAIVMGNSDLKEMKAGRMDRSGEGLTKAGVIIGIIMLILAVIGTIFNIATGAFNK